MTGNLEVESTSKQNGTRVYKKLHREGRHIPFFVVFMVKIIDVVSLANVLVFQILIKVKKLQYCWSKSIDFGVQALLISKNLNFITTLGFMNLFILKKCYF